MALLDSILDITETKRFIEEKRKNLDEAIKESKEWTERTSTETLEFIKRSRALGKESELIRRRHFLARMDKLGHELGPIGIPVSDLIKERRYR